MNTYAINTERNGIEITFDGVPSVAIREQLKSAAFRWHRVKKVWYAKNTAERLELAKKLCGDETDAKEEPTKGTKQDHVKIYWNGMKIAGGDLIRCFYSLDNYADHHEGVAIYARDYKDLPRDLLPVENNSDSYTDYFEKDRANITPEHPLYKYFRYAAEKARARDAKKHIERLKAALSMPERFEGQRQMYKADIATNEKYISEFEAANDPGQPTQEDLEKIDRQRTEAENARKAAEHQKKLEERERMLNLRCNGQRFIISEMNTHPIEEGAPCVLIHWSEHPAFYAWGDDELKLSITAAENILFEFDKPQKEGGYYKTKFSIFWTNENGTEGSYQGRYDLGDNDGGLIQHIRAIGEWKLTHDDFGHEKDEPDETNDILDFAHWLSSFVA